MLISDIIDLKAKIQSYRLAEQNKGPKNKPLNIWPYIKMPRLCKKERIISSTNSVGKTGYPHTKKWGGDEVGP